MMVEAFKSASSTSSGDVRTMFFDETLPEEGYYCEKWVTERLKDGYSISMFTDYGERIFTHHKKKDN